MITNIISVKLPATVHAAAVENPDGTFDVYVNEIFSKNTQEEAMRDLFQQIEEARNEDHD